MATQAWLLMTEAECLAARALDELETYVAFGGRKIDNPLANQLGEGTLVGGATDYYVVGARLLNDPDYSRYYELCSTYPIRTMDSDTLFLPDPPID